jgi:hypothetical protein
MNKSAYKCLSCNTINIFSGPMKDGHNCIKCKGPLAPIGEAIDSGEISTKHIHIFSQLRPKEE